MNRSSLEFRVKNLIAWLLATRLAGPTMTRVLTPFTRRQVRHLGLTISTQHPAISPRTRAQMFWGMYERPEVRFIQKYLAGASEVIELGAGIGVTGAHLLSVMHPGGRLLCVEANPLLVTALAIGLRSRASVAGIELEVVRAAIHDGHGRLPVAFDGDLLTARLDPAGSKRGPRQANTTSLGELARRHSFERFALVCDIEGAEAAFILGEGDCLRRCDRLIIELHETEWRGRRVSPGELAGALAHRHGFRELASKGPVLALAR